MAAGAIRTVDGFVTRRRFMVSGIARLAMADTLSLRF
jgi:hypothetical protein